MNRMVIFVAVLWVSLAAHGAPSLHFVEEGGWPPFTLSKEGDTRDGLSWALISEVGRRAGFDAKLSLFPMKRVLYVLERGEYDAVTTISRNTERDAILDYSEPTFRKAGYAYYRAGEVVEWKEYKDFAKMRIGVARGHNLGKAFTDAVQGLGLTVDEGDSDEQNFMKLVAGRVDVVFANYWTALYVLREPRFQSLIQNAKKPLYTTDYHIGVSKKSTPGHQLLPGINKAIRAMKADGSLDAMLVDYLNPARQKALAGN